MAKYICATCGKEFESEFKSKTPKYCSRVCHDSHNNRKNNFCVVCGSLLPKFASKYCSTQCRQQANNANENRIAHGVLSKTCIVCGKKFETYRDRKETCSDECRRKWHNSRISDSRLNSTNKIDHDISLFKVFDIDSGICYLCGEKCDFSDCYDRAGRKIVGRNYPSIDHVIPLSKGGMHEWSNVRLAHIKCNSSKNNKIEVMQHGFNGN